MKVLSLMKSGKSATRLDQICVRREIIQLFANMCSTFSTHAYLHIFAFFLFLERFCTLVLIQLDLLNLLIILPLLINQVIFNFLFTNTKVFIIAMNSTRYNLLKAFLDNGDVLGVELLGVSLVDQAHQQQGLSVILRWVGDDR